MKLCPYCSQGMEDAATICQYCGRDWKTGVSHFAPIEPVQRPATSGDSLNPEGGSRASMAGGLGVIPIAVGVGVALATGMVVYVIMFGLAWSEIHSGRRDRPGLLEIAFAYVLLCTPAILGALAAWAAHRSMARKAGTGFPGESH
jgi:hypothetical protein